MRNLGDTRISPSSSSSNATTTYLAVCLNTVPALPPRAWVAATVTPPPTGKSLGMPRRVVRDCGGDSTTVLPPPSSASACRRRGGGGDDRDDRPSSSDCREHLLALPRGNDDAMMMVAAATPSSKVVPSLVGVAIASGLVVAFASWRGEERRGG